MDFARLEMPECVIAAFRWNAVIEFKESIKELRGQDTAVVEGWGPHKYGTESPSTYARDHHCGQTTSQNLAV